MDTTLIGVVIGGLIGVASTLVAQILARRHRRSDLLREAAASFIRTTHAKFYADQRVHLAVFSLMDARRDADISESVLSERERAERDATKEYNSYVDSAHNTLAEIELLEPRLKVAGYKLIEASQIPANSERGTYSRDQQASLATARANFIKCVRRYI
ncbi:MAG: hypothetical protein QM711_04370 [Micropruina sp.]|uniref:hypothetical protein n=1 Tax=Micropruina sp. TaxID=2737536 RepID=UPI0039E64BEF